jgi:hypothetical protein
MTVTNGTVYEGKWDNGKQIAYEIVPYNIFLKTESECVICLNENNQPTTAD